MYFTSTPADVQLNLAANTVGVANIAPASQSNCRTRPAPPGMIYGGDTLPTVRHYQFHRQRRYFGHQCHGGRKQRNGPWMRDCCRQTGAIRGETINTKLTPGFSMLKNNEEVADVPSNTSIIWYKVADAHTRLQMYKNIYKKFLILKMFWKL